MKYIFEDKDDDLLSELFQLGYSKEYVESHFRYAYGDGKLEDEIDKALVDGDTEIYIYIDLVPDNINTANLYRKLISKYKTNQDIIIIPIPCSEYYVIKSLIGTQACKNEALAKSIINREFYVNSSIIESETDRKFCKNFEKFCKLFLKKRTQVLDCANTSRLFNGGKDLNKLYSRYYTTNCACDSKVECDNDTIENKVLRLLISYPCIPKGCIIGETIGLSKTDIIYIHRQLVDEYNKMVELYKSLDTRKIKYIPIRYMPWVV